MLIHMESTSDVKNIIIVEEPKKTSVKKIKCESESETSDSQPGCREMVPWLPPTIEYDRIPSQA